MKIRIISQSEKIYDGVCSALSAPTVLGQITILPKHANLITILDIGILVLHNQGEKKEIVINGGILEVIGDRINILANEANLREDLVEQDILEAIESAQRQLTSDISKTDFIRIERELRYHKFKHSLLNK